MGDETPNTIFDKILRRELPADVVYEDEEVLAFRDINPQAPVHVLVIPKWRVERFVDLKERGAQEVGAFFTRVAKVAHQLGLGDNGFRIVVNNGADGCQTVAYLHAHILGGRQLQGTMG